MKIDTEAFRAALDLAGRAAERLATTLDILRFARFTAKGGEFTLACNDLTMYAEARGECGAGELAFCVRADRLLAALATAGDSIDLSVKGQMLTWKSGKARYQMSTLPVEDFPAIKREQEPRLTLEDPTIAESLKRVAFGCATKDIRPWVHGILIECAKTGDVTLVATDGAKLASLLIETRANAEAAIIVHRDTVNALPDGAERLRIYETTVEFDYPNGLIVARTIEGKFPEWRRAFPSGKPAAKLTTDRRALAHAIKAALPFDMAGSIRFVVNGGSLHIEAADQSGESAEVKLDGNGDGEADAWFASAVLSPAIQAARGEDVVMAFGQHGQSAIIEDGPLRCACAPMRR